MLKSIARLLTLTRGLFLTLVVLLALAFNLLTMTFAPLAGAMFDLASRLGLKTALVTASMLDTATSNANAQRDRAAKLQEDLNAERAKAKKVEEGLVKERRRSANLSAERDDLKARGKLLENRLKNASTKIEKLQDDIAVLRRTPPLPNNAIATVDSTTSRIIRRSGINASRNLAAMPLESLPVVGALTIVSVTALELYDACETAREMTVLRRMVGLDVPDLSVINAVCNKIPTLAVPQLTLAECRSHARQVLENLGADAAAPINRKCDCLELPNGCPGDSAEAVSFPPPPPAR